MEKYYVPIDGKNMEIDAPSVEHLFGVADKVVESIATFLGSRTYRFAFYNTGELCQVSYERGSEWLKVECFGGTSRCKEILGWLKRYLVNGMEGSGFGTDIVMNDGHFFAHFYEKNPE